MAFTLDIELYLMVFSFPDVFGCAERVLKPQKFSRLTADDKLFLQEFSATLVDDKIYNSHGNDDCCSKFND
jgi:hypothetical protein